MYKCANFKAPATLGCALYYQIVNPNRFVALAQKHVYWYHQHNKVGMDDIERVLEEQVTQVIHSLCIHSTSGQFKKLSPGPIWFGTGQSINRETYNTGITKLVFAWPLQP